MTKAIPTVQKYMTTLPHSIGTDQTLAKAEQMMRELHIRHLPVLEGGKLVGIITDRDVKLVETFRDVDAKKATVLEAYTPEPFSVRPSAPLDEVVATMAEEKFGCALVVDNEKLVGIFTWVDGLRAFSELLSSRLQK